MQEMESELVKSKDDCQRMRKINQDLMDQLHSTHVE